MPSKINRVVLSESVSDDGRLIFRLYDTGSFSVIDAAHPTIPKTGAPNSFLRINNLNEPEDKLLLPRLQKLVEEAAEIDYHFSVEFYRAHYGEFVVELLDDYTLEPRMKFAMFVSAISDTRAVSYDVIKEAALANAPRLELAYKLRSLQFFLRPDLGLNSMDLERKAFSNEEFLERNEQINNRKEHPFFKLVNVRMGKGITTSRLAGLGKRADEPSPKHYSTTGFPGSMLLTTEENQELAKAMGEASGQRGYYTDDIQRLLTFTWIAIGHEKTMDLLHFVHKFTPVPEYSYGTRSFSLSGISFELGEVTENAVFQALRQTDMPLEWAISMEV